MMTSPILTVKRLNRRGFGPAYFIVSYFKLISALFRQLISMNYYHRHTNLPVKFEILPDVVDEISFDPRAERLGGLESSDTHRAKKG